MEGIYAKVKTLILIGYWSSSESPEWPDPKTMIDLSWDEDERDAVVTYLEGGLLARSSMGLSPCRICGADNGALELTDGKYIWPSGLAHYVSEHKIRLPDPFSAHAIERVEELESVNVDTSWWASISQNK